jgi:ribonuclease P protein component
VGVGQSPSAGEPLGTTPATRRPFAFPRERRVTRPADLDAVRQRGRRVRTEHLDVRVLVAAPVAGVAAVTGVAEPRGRVGIVVPRHKHTAVDRNRVKRRLRELVRTRLLPTLPPCDVVIRARTEAYDDSFDALARQIERAAREIAREIARSMNPGTGSGS